MVAVQVLGNDHTVAFAGSQGNLQLNVYKSAMLHNVLTPIELLTDTSRSFFDRCAIGIEPNKTRIREHLDNCVMLVTALFLDEIGDMPLELQSEDTARSAGARIIQL